MAKNVKELLKATRQRRKAEITLTTGASFDMYFTPLSEAEDEAIREAIKNDNTTNAYGLRVLIRNAEYEDGTKMFDPVTDKGTMRQEYAKADLTIMMEALIFNGGCWQARTPKAIKEAIKKDSALMLRLALCKVLGKTLSELERDATQDDIIMHAAYEEILADQIPAVPQASQPRRR